MPCLGRLDLRGRVCGEGERARRLRRGLQQLRERRGDTGTTYTRRQQGPAFFGGQDEDDDVVIVEADDGDPHTSDRLSAAVEEDEDETPAEFLDAITHSLMLLPMTLPSGHTVDRSTVDR